MTNSLSRIRPAVLGIAIATLAFTPNVFSQQTTNTPDHQNMIERARQRQEKLQQVTKDKAAYAASIVERWQTAARDSGKWDENFAGDLQKALVSLQPESLLDVGEAPTFDTMMKVLAYGRQTRTNPTATGSDTLSPRVIGDTADDLVFTPITPCRLVDTRVAGGALAAGVSRFFDVDGTSFTAQGGSSTGCGMPFGVPRAVAMTITVTGPSAPGYFAAWGLGTQPLSSVLNFVAGETLANTTVVPVVPGGGADFTLLSSANAHAVIDAVGYYAAPVATALDCTTASSTLTAVATNVWTSIDAVCPTGRTATGGGYNSPTEGTLGYPGVWTTSLPGSSYGFNGWRVWVDNQSSGSRSVQAWAVCCRIPGR